MLNRATKIKQLCKQYCVMPEKLRGQHFLIDDSFVKKMVDAAEITKKDTVVEVGPGWGILTEELVKQAGRIIAVEIEEKMVDYLHKYINISAYQHLEFMRGDVRRFWKKMPKEFYHVIANIPYHITSQIIRGFLEKTPNPPVQMILMIQKEVADRIVAKPGDMSLLALSVQLYGKPKKLFKVPKGAFWPQPEVDSTVIHIKNIHRPDPEQTNQFFALANRAFKSKRKMLSTSLAGTQLGKTKAQIAINLKKCGIDPTARPQDLSVEEWKITMKQCNN